MAVDFKKLRSELIEICGTATFSGLPAAFGELLQIEQASDEELLPLAALLGHDISHCLLSDDG